MIGIGFGTYSSSTSHAIPVPSLPSPLALWKLDEGTGYVGHNAFASPWTNRNLCWSPEQTFAADWTNAGSLTFTEASGANPNGDVVATRVQNTSGAQFAWLTLALPAGTYTYSIYAKSNTGTNQSPVLGYLDGTTSYQQFPALTVTSSWQRFTHTFTSTGTINNILIWGDGSTPYDILVWGVQFEAGSSATAYHTPTVDALLNLSALPTWTSTGIHLGSAAAGGTAIRQVPATLTGLSWYAVLKQTAPGGDELVITDIANYTNANLAGQGGALNGLMVGSTGNAPTLNLTDGNWWVIAATYDGTTVRLYVNGTEIASVALASFSFSSRAFFLGDYFANSLGFVGDLGAIALYDAGHSFTDVQAMTDYLYGLMAGRGVTIANLSKLVLGDGDSIMAGQSITTPFLTTAMGTISPTVQFRNFGHAGDNVAALAARASTVDGTLLPAKSKTVLCVLVGHNDLVAGDSAATFVANLKALCLAHRAAGVDKILVGTLLPSTASGFNTVRNAANALIYGDTSFYDGLMDFAADATVGPDAAASNATLYPDGTHPSQTAATTYLAPICAAAIAGVI